MDIKSCFRPKLNFGILIAISDISLIVDMHELDQKFGSVDEISFNKFRYRNMAEVGYDTLLTSPLSYLSRFTGLGQVKPKSGDTEY